MKQNKLLKLNQGIICLAISYTLLIPGLVLPMVTLSGSVKILTFRKTLFRNSRSVIQTLDNLLDSGNYLVFTLILSFSILVPIIKGIFLLKALNQKSPHKKEKTISFIGNISKWAMADVFVVGIFVAFLSAKATENMDAVLGVGFYFFSAYCIFSIFSLHLLKKHKSSNQLLMVPVVPV